MSSSESNTKENNTNLFKTDSKLLQVLILFGIYNLVFAFINSFLIGKVKLMNPEDKNWKDTAANNLQKKVLLPPIIGLISSVILGIYYKLDFGHGFLLTALILNASIGIASRNLFYLTPYKMQDVIDKSIKSIKFAEDNKNNDIQFSFSDITKLPVFHKKFNKIKLFCNNLFGFTHLNNKKIRDKQTIKIIKHYLNKNKVSESTKNLFLKELKTKKYNNNNLPTLFKKIGKQVQGKCKVFN
jgi:hypothetical protein